MGDVVAMRGSEADPGVWIRKLHTPFEVRARRKQPTNNQVHIVVLAKDEERCIGRCLDSVTGCGFDSVVVIDTGSVDNTPEIVRRYQDFGVRLVQRAWSDSFAKARNFAFDVIGEGWMVFIDADEWLPVGQGARLSECLATISAIDNVHSVAFAPVIWNERGNEYVDEVPRIVRADGDIRFRGAVHEYPVITTDGVDPVALIGIDVEFMHDGYEPTVFHAKEKFSRNEALLTRARTEDPNNPRWMYFTMRDRLPHLRVDDIYGLCEELRSANTEGAETGDWRPAPQYYRMALGFACQGLAAKHDWPSVHLLCLEMERIDDPKSADAHYFMSLFKIVSNTATEEDLVWSVELRQDEAAISKSTLCPHGRHIDALISALLEKLIGADRAVIYRKLCHNWNDVFFADSRLRG